MADDPLQHRAHADLIAQRAADQLRDLLRTVASQIDPFPPFPGSMFSYGIEVEGIASQDPEHGCVVLGEDGELFELRIGIDMEQVASGGDHVATRDEQRVPLEHLDPADYVAYAHHALVTAVEHLLRKQEGADGEG